MSIKCQMLQDTHLPMMLIFQKWCNKQLKSTCNSSRTDRHVKKMRNSHLNLMFDINCFGKFTALVSCLLCVIVKEGVIYDFFLPSHPKENTFFSFSFRFVVEWYMVWPLPAFIFTWIYPQINSFMRHETWQCTLGTEWTANNRIILNI